MREWSSHICIPWQVSSFLGISLSDATSWGSLIYLCQDLLIRKSRKPKDTSPYSNSVLRMFLLLPILLSFLGVIGSIKLKDLFVPCPQEWDHTFVFAGPPEPWWVLSPWEERAGEIQCFLRLGSLFHHNMRFHCYFHSSYCFYMATLKLTDQSFQLSWAPNTS